MTMLQRVGLFASALAATALLTAPIALADGDHGDHGGRDRDRDDHVVIVQNGTAPVVDVDEDNDNDLNEDINEDINEDRDEMQVAPRVVVVDNDQEVNDLNDDDD